MITFKEYLIETQLEEANPKSPAIQDRAVGLNNRPEESYEGTPRRKRRGQRARRGLRSAGYTKDYRPSEEEEAHAATADDTKLPAMLRRQSGTGDENEIQKKKRGRPKKLQMSKKQAWF